MCGIAGFWSDARRPEPEGLNVARAMADRLVHRGPDDSGEWYDPECGTGFGFRRLSIVDLSPAGHQPMTSASGRYILIFNGEVYNFERLRGELGPRDYRGHSDTEVILAAIEEWGLETAVTRFIGMFAFALWDRRERRLHLVRDRIGVKPLMYGWHRGSLLFGSELKALAAHPDFQAEIDRASLTLYARHGYVPAPRTIFQRTHKVPPGTILTFAHPKDEPAPVPYWSAREAAIRGASEPFRGSEEAAIDELDALLHDSIALRRIADVPLGAFLSGGIDSSTVTAIMQAQSPSPVKSFSIGSTDPRTNEAPAAAAVAKHLGTDHTELYVSPEDALAVVPELVGIFDEPLGDSSQIPTLLVSRLARRHVTVSLSGDGGDELFGGYHRYFVGQRLWSVASRMPAPLRGAASAVLTTGGGVMPVARLNTRIEKFARALAVDDPDALYLQAIYQWRDVVLGGEIADDPLAPAHRAPLREPAARAMFLDLISYLPDDILMKVDRASMAASLEAREPLLDHRIVELALRLPLRMKLRDGRGKWILRRVLQRYVPEALVQTKKKGFSVPVDAWLRGPLRPWAESLLSEDRLRADGYFDPALVRRHWIEHLSGRRDWQNHLWAVLMFQTWLERWRF